MLLALAQVEVEVEPLPGMQVVPEEEVLDARLDSKVGIRRHFLKQSSASVECRHVGGTYHDIAVHYMEVEDRIRG